MLYERSLAAQQEESECSEEHTQKKKKKDYEMVISFELCTGMS